MKNPNHLTMADKSALNLLAKVTNKFESEGTILSELVNFASVESNSKCKISKSS